MGKNQVKDAGLHSFSHQSQALILLACLGFVQACASPSNGSSVQVARPQKQRQPLTAKKHFDEGLRQKNAGDHGQAAALFENATRADPLFGLAFLEWGHSLLLHSDDQASIVRVLKQAIELLPKNPRARIYYGQVLGRLGRWSDSIVQLEKALSLRPTLTAPRLDLAEAFQQIGQVHSAQRQLEGLLASRPRHIQARVRLGQLFAGMKRFHAAAKQIEIAAKQSQASAALYRRAAQFYATAGEDEKARHLRVRADEIDPPTRSREYRPLRKRKVKGS